MKLRNLLLMASLVTALGAGVLVTPAFADPGGCPSDAFVFGSGCTAENKDADCQKKAHDDYGPNCTVICASCASGSYNCYTNANQC